MQNEVPEVKPAPARNPADMLARQVELLEAIRESLDNQQRVVMHLAQQQNTQAEQLSYLSDALLPDAERNPGHQWVKVQDFNMPFFNIAGFMVKVALASIPAAIIIGILWLVAAAVFGMLGFGLF